MTELVRVPLTDDTMFIAEVDRADLDVDAVVLASVEPGRAVTTAANTLEAGLASLRPVVDSLVQTFRAAGPDAFDIEFGVKLGGETGVILAKGSAEVSFKVTLHWDRAARTVRPAEPRSDER